MAKQARRKEFSLAVLFVLVCLPASQAQVPSAPPTQTPQPSTVDTQLSVEEALRLAHAQASTFQTAVINERIAAEDVRQAQAAFLPKVTTPLSYIYTSPALGLPPVV